MTARPLDPAFPIQSDLSLRAPIDVPEDEQLLELEEEMEKRQRVYPGFVERQMMDGEDARRHIAIWQALIDDHHRNRHFIAALQAQGMTPAVKLANDPPWRGNWPDRVRELRRELALRRAAYPKWIANPTNPLTEADARRKMERLDAIHHRYWIGLEHFNPPIAAAFPDDAAQLAALDAAAYLAHPLIRGQFQAVRDMIAWQAGMQPLDRLPAGERTFHVAPCCRSPSTPAYWTGRLWARGQRLANCAGPIGPHQPLTFRPQYFREQEKAA